MKKTGYVPGSVFRILAMAAAAFTVNAAMGQQPQGRQNPSSDTIVVPRTQPRGEQAQGQEGRGRPQQQNQPQQAGQQPSAPQDALGAKLEQGGQGQSGLRISNVDPNSAAAQAGLQANDRILSVDGRPFRQPRHLMAYLSAQAGRPVPFVVERNGRQFTIEVMPQLVSGDQAWLGVLLEEREEAQKGQNAAGAQSPGGPQNPAAKPSPSGAQPPAKRPAETPGVEISQVYPNSPAARAGLQRGDVVMQINGQKTDDAAELISIIHDLKPQAKAEFKIQRNKQEQSIPVTLGSRSEEFAEGRFGQGRPWPGQFPNQFGQFGNGPFAGQEFGGSQMGRLEEELRQLRDEVRQLREQLQQRPAPEASRRENRS